MSSSQSKTGSCSGGNTGVVKGPKRGKEYEKLSLLLLAKKVYELSIDNDSQFRDFAIGREVGIGEDRKLDDNVFRYEDKDSRNLIFIQIKDKTESKQKYKDKTENKDKQDDSLKINSRILSGSGSGKMNRDFSLREYFISYLSIRKEIKVTKSKEFRNGKIKYVAIFTDIGLDKDDLKNNGFLLNEAPDDVRTLFQIKKSSLGTQETNNCYQLHKISEVLERKLKRSSDLHRIATEFARYVVLENHRKNNVMKTDKAPIKYYHVALEKEVILKSNIDPKHAMKDELYCVAKFRNDFINNNETGPKKQLLNAIFEAIREIDKSKRDNSDDDLKNDLRNTEWKVVSHFGDYLPKKTSSELRKIAKEFATYIANENERDKIIFGKKEPALTHYDVAFEREVITISDQANSSYCKAQFRDDFINNRETGPKQDLKKAIFDSIREFESKKDASEDELENLLRGLELKVDPYFVKTRNFEEDLQNEWILIQDVDITDFLNCLVLFVNQPNETDLITQISSVKEVFLQGTRVGEALDNMDTKFRDRMEKTLGIYKEDSNEESWMYGKEINTFVKEQQAAVNVTVLTCMYEQKVMQYGKFKKLGKLESNLRNFLNDKFSKVLCLCSSATMLTLIKVLMYLNTKNSTAKQNCISIELDDAKWEIITDIIEKAFKSESYNLLTIECQNGVSEDILALYSKFSDIITSNANKKIILIINANILNDLTEKIRSDLNCIYKNHKINYDPEKLCIKETDDIIVKDFEPNQDPFKKKIISFQGQREKINLETLTGIADWESYIADSSLNGIQNEEGIIDAITLVEILRNKEIIVGNRPQVTDSLECAYTSLSFEINKENLVKKLLQQRPDSNTNVIYIVSGIPGSNKNEIMSKLFNNLEIINEKEIIENQLEYIGSDSRIQITDDKFKEEDFKDICHRYPEKKNFGICIKEENKFLLQKFYNPNYFYLKREFKKIIITREVKKLLIDQNLLEIFIFLHVNDIETFMISLALTDEREKTEVENNYNKSTVKLFTSEEDAAATFQDHCKENKTVHWLTFEENPIVWYSTHGSVSKLRAYIDHEESETAAVQEKNLIKQIRYCKTAIIVGDPGMGKTAELTKFHETKYESESFIKSAWVVKINLRYHELAIKNMKIEKGIIDVVNFMSEIDSKLNNSLSKNLLINSLRKNTISKHLLLIVDGFDEVLDKKARENIISLLKFINEETPSKLWVCSRRHYKETLEEELSAFAIELNPMNDDSAIAYIQKYLRDRFSLILNVEHFDKKDEKQENESIQTYASAFFKKIKSIFEDDMTGFVGTPLLFHLMLKDSEIHFKNWIEKNEDPNLTFSYLGNEAQIYEKLIDGMYHVWFEKYKGTDTKFWNVNKHTSDTYNQRLAECLIFNLGVDEIFEELEEKDIQAIVFSAGIIKSDGSNMEFFPKKLKDFFAAELFVDLIKERKNPFTNREKNKRLLKDILKKPDYKQIRGIINVKLINTMETEGFEGCLKYYGMIIKDLLGEKESSWIDEEGTVLHIAVAEGNKNIVCFLLESLKVHTDVLKIFLFIRDKGKRTVLHLACRGNDVEIVKLLLDAAVAIPKHIYEKYLYSLNDAQENALHEAVKKSNNILILKGIIE